MNEARKPAALAILASAVGLACGAFLARDDLARYRNEAERIDAAVLFARNYGAEGLVGAVAAGWEEIPGAGLAPLPGGQARLDVDLAGAPPGRALYASLDLSADADTEVEVACTLDGGRHERIVHRGPAGARFVLLSESLPAGARPSLRITARRAGDARNASPAVVRRLEVAAGNVPDLPDAPAILAPAALAALLFLLAWVAAGSAAGATGAGLAGAALGALALRLAPDLAGPPLAWAIAVLATLSLPLAAARADRAGAAALAVLVGIAYWALLFRWRLLDQAVFSELEPDTLDFLGLANRLGWIYDTGYREPGHVWAVKLGTFVLGSGHATPRLVSVVLSIVALFLTYRIGSRIFDRPVGVVAAFTTASADFLIGQSVRGLRFELYAIEILLFLELVLLEKRSWRTDLAAGLLGGLLLATRLPSFGFVAVGLFAIFLRRPERHPARLALLVLPALLLVAGHLHHNRRSTGDPFDSVNRHLRYYRNREFAGAPGHRTWEEVERDPYGGASTTTFDFLFRVHSRRQLAAYTIEGLDRIFVGRFARDTYFTGTRIRHLLCLVGLVLCLSHRRGRFVPLYVVLVMGPMPFLLATQREFDPRLVYAFSPFLEIAAAWAVLFPLRAFGSATAPRSAPRP